MIEKEQNEWVEEVLDDDVVGMLNIQFDNMFGESDWVDTFEQVDVTSH